MCSETGYVKGTARTDLHQQIQMSWRPWETLGSGTDLNTQLQLKDSPLRKRSFSVASAFVLDVYMNCVDAALDVEILHSRGSHCTPRHISDFKIFISVCLVLILQEIL